MIYNKIIKLKKYLFLISILFLGISLSHLIYIFLYDDSRLMPIKWWTVSEWLVGNFPSLNPLKPLKWNNKYVVNLLYRSLLKYDNEQNKIVSDLASCDISNLKNIECYLKDNIFWSNWDLITADDVLATYNLLQSTWVNKIYSSLLEETQIEKNGNSIIFKNSKRDLAFLNIFFQPILSEKNIDSLWNETIFWDFPTHEQMYSWDFMISNISSDLTIWITEISLERNTFNDKWNIAKLILKIFPNTNSLLQNKELINIFNDTSNIIWDSTPRLEANKYTLPQYTSLFINTSNIVDVNLRNFIFNKINSENLIKVLWEDNFSLVKNPYLWGSETKREITNKNFEKIIENLGYIKKSKIIENYLPSKKEKYSQEAEIEEKEEEIVIEVNEEDLKIDEFQEDSKYITSPDYVDKYNFITKDNILLIWNAWKLVEEIYVNDYKLANYKKGNPKFYYRLKESYSSLKKWVNNYKIYFVENGKKQLKEELTFIYSPDSRILETETKDFVRNLYIEKKKEELARELEKKKEEEANAEKIEIDKKRLEELSNLDEKFYYNDDLEKFSINLYYISAERELEETAYFIKNSLLEIGVAVELFPITLTDLRELLWNKDKYDMILTWLNLWYFDYNIFPYFHSSQAKNWYNFSNMKKTSLDILLEDLKSSILSEEEKTKIQNKVLEILSKEQVVKTLYTPKINLLIDKNLKNVSIPSKLVNKESRKDLFNSLYMKEEKIINFNNKWIMDFFYFLLRKLNA